MIKLQNNFTTIKQSKRLLELGVPAWTADCFRWDFGSAFGVSEGQRYSTDISVICFEYQRCLNEKLPCWSVGRLMEIIDICDNEDSSGDFGEEYPSTTKVMRKLNMDYITYLVKSIGRATELKTIDFSKLEE